MRLPAFVLVLFISLTATAQAPKLYNSSEIYAAIEKANTLASVLYVAAHPDDENTSLISYLANEKHARTAYLSLTRGDGGQNLIGPELRELLGVIRTHELLEARQIDGGEQRFTRANDFGYSKHPDETLKIWDKDDVLSDVVKAIRQFKPDVIINRFDHRTPGKTHGHHTASAMLSLKAYDLANNVSAYPEQLNALSTWQPKRLFFNTSWWFYGGQEAFENADKSNLLEFETGVYYASQGLSNSEISALSRSQHKSQGFGRIGARGTDTTYLELIEGDLPQDKTNIFEGINTSWSRVKGGAPVGALLDNVLATFNFKEPSASIPQLLKAYKTIEELEDTHWKSLKLKELRDIIAASAGLYLEVVASAPMATRGDTITLSLEAINRSQIPMKFKGIALPASQQSISESIALENNQPLNKQLEYTLSKDAIYTSPYWLKNKGTLGMYSVEKDSNIGKPTTPNPHQAVFSITVQGQDLLFTRPIIFKTGDPVEGEVYEPFDIVPKVSLSMEDNVVVFDTNDSKTITVTVNSNTSEINGKLQLETPEGWTVLPKTVDVSLENKGASKVISFKVTPPQQQSEGYLNPQFITPINTFTKSLHVLNYDHIPTQRVLLPAQSKVVRLDIKTKGKNIGYIEGAGDVVPESLRQIGYDVTLIAPENISSKILNTYDAIVIGIRAYNTVEELKLKQNILLDYVKNGGNLIVQYNTSHRLQVSDNIAPYPIKLSRDRVTNELAKVKFLSPQHPVLNTPNTITSKDFENWVQERGLYFPDEWSSEFTPILEMNDDGETPKQGSLLVAKYGDGYYVYTGLSFFREFPAGVSGAYRLFANLLSLGK